MPTFGHQLKVDLEIMTTKGYSPFPKALELMLHYQMSYRGQFAGEGFSPFTEMKSLSSTAPADWASIY